MTETNPELNVEALAESARIMFVTINAVFGLHKPEDGGELVICGHCSKVGAGTEPVIYPCPTSSILLADMVIEPSESAESEEPSA